MQFSNSPSHDVVPGYATWDSSPTHLPRLGTHCSLWDVTTGRTTEAVISVDWHTWREPSLLQKQKSSDLVEGSNPVSLEKPNPLTNPTQPWCVIWKGGPLKSSMDPLFQSEGPWGLKTPCHVTHFSLQLASFFYGDRHNPISTNLPKLWISSPAPGNETVNGTRQPYSSTVYGMHSTPPLGQHEEGGQCHQLAMSTHQATIERQTPLLVWWSTKWFTICPFRLILTSMKINIIWISFVLFSITSTQRYVVKGIICNETS